jgi:hypothetical protein
MGFSPKQRGGCKELTKGLGTEEEAPSKEIRAARRSSDGSSGAVMLRTREREGGGAGGAGGGDALI